MDDPAGDLSGRAVDDSYLSAILRIRVSLVCWWIIMFVTACTVKRKETWKSEVSTVNLCVRVPLTASVTQRSCALLYHGILYSLALAFVFNSLDFGIHVDF